MLTLAGAATVQLRQESRRLTVCGVVQKLNGSIIRCTQHDAPLKITSGDYAGRYESTAAVSASTIQSSSDMSVDNLETTGAVASVDFAITGFTAADIAAGQFRNAPFQIFLCQWDDPTAWQKTIRRGYLGQITRTAEGAFTAEWRGILQVLQQNVGRTYGENCDVVRFGDSRCTFDIATVTYSATVTNVVSRKEFTLSIDGLPSPEPGVGYFNTGEFTFLTGTNAGYEKQIKIDSIGGTLGHVQTWESFPTDVQIGDTATIIAGCDRTFRRCQFWNNILNWRGHGRWIPGIPKIIRAP